MLRVSDSARVGIIMMGDDASSEEEGVYTVQSVVAKRTARRRGGKVEYLVRWEGYNSDDDTDDKYGEADAPGHVADVPGVDRLRGLAAGREGPDDSNDDAHAACEDENFEFSA